MIQQYYVKEKVDAGHSLDLRVKNWDGWVLIPSNVRLLAYSYVLIGCFSRNIPM